ncbi:MAG: protein kinase [Ignavibacteriales bacterium]|nr:protein kinase [Ignavibacteriales bacterium]
MIGQTISHYQILEKLGEGGMGVVYKAQDTKLQRFVALKFLSTHLSASEESKTRFMQEARAAAALNHPNILGIYEISRQDGNEFFVMEYVEGTTLKSHIENQKSSSGTTPHQALAWTEQIARGLKAAHGKNIVHRDIKPENIMIASDGLLKIMDFGIAKLKSSSGLTRTGTSLGTLSYMSPEQAQGVATDARCDIWSLGVVFYELLTGERPFRAEHDAGLLYLIVNEDPPAPSALDKKIPRQLDAVVMKMLQKDRAKRFETMEALLLELTDVQQAIAMAAGASKTKAIAVLPFGNISPDKESDYFSDGLTEELIASLARLKDVRLVPRATSMQYKGTTKDIKTIARELATRYILSGSVRKFQDNLRITVELIDVDTDAQLWAETYKGKLEDVFDIQEQVSKQIVDALMVKLSPTEKVVLTKRSTLNAEAFDCNLRARDFLYRRTKNSIQFAIQLFQKAIELDQRYSGAYAGLGEAYATLYQQFERKELWLDRAVESGLKALMYDSSSSDAYAALGLAYFHKKSVEDALAASQRAIELDPNNFVGYWILGRIYHTTDRDHEAVELFKKVITLNPDFYTAYGDLKVAYGRIGDKERGHETMLQAIQVFRRFLPQHPDDARAHMYFANALVQEGERDEAKAEAAKALELSPGDPNMLYNAACFYALLNELKLAIETLKNAITAGYQHYEWIQRDSDLNSIRQEPEYVELMKGK